MSRLVSVLESVISKLARYDEGSILGSILSFTVTIEHSFCFVSSFQPNAHLLFLPPFYHHLALVSSAENTFSCFSSFIFTSTFIAGKMFKLGYGFLFLSESLFEIDNLPPNSFSTATLPPTHWYSSSLAFLVFASLFSWFV